MEDGLKNINSEACSAVFDEIGYLAIGSEGYETAVKTAEGLMDRDIKYLELEQRAKELAVKEQELKAKFISDSVNAGIKVFEIGSKAFITYESVKLFIILEADGRVPAMTKKIVDALLKRWIG